MHFKYIFLFLVLILELGANDRLDKYDVIKQIENNAFINANEIDLTDLKNNVNEQNKILFNSEFMDKLEKSKEMMTSEIRRIQGEDVYLENMNLSLKNSNDINSISNFLKNNRIYIFASESMPIKIWSSYSKVMSDNNLTNTFLVLRGCIGGNCKKIAPTIEFVEKVISYDKSTDINPNIIIDPLLFRRYNIKEVPCFIFAENVQKIEDLKSEGMEENFISSNKFMSCGAWDFLWHLKNLNKQANNDELKQVIKILEPKGKL